MVTLSYQVLLGLCAQAQEDCLRAVLLPCSTAQALGYAGEQREQRLSKVFEGLCDGKPVWRFKAISPSNLWGTAMPCCFTPSYTEDSWN